jgi:hypothetical protein
MNLWTAWVRFVAPLMRGQVGGYRARFIRRSIVAPGSGVIWNRILFETPFMCAKANPALFAKREVHTEDAARRGRKPRVS